MKLSHYNNPLLSRRWISNIVESSVGFLWCLIAFGIIYSLRLVQRRVLKINRYTVLADVMSVVVDENDPSK